MLGENHHHLTVDHNHLTIDHNLYSRQIGAYGVEAMGKIVALKVFIYGLRGVISFLILIINFTSSVLKPQRTLSLQDQSKLLFKITIS